MTATAHGTRRPKHRYELRGYAKTRIGTWPRVRSMTFGLDDPHAMAVEYWRLAHSLPKDWRIEVRDMQYGGRIAPIVSYEELLARAKKPRFGEFRSTTDQKKEQDDRKLAEALAVWATDPPQSTISPAVAGRALDSAHDIQRVRDLAYQQVRDADVRGHALDLALHRIEKAIRVLH
jgi:hypothetical protein